MSKYIKLFETHSDYNTYINSQDKVLPNVSYCENENEVHYNPWTDPRLIVKYLVEDATNPTHLYTYTQEEGMTVVGSEMFDKVEIDNMEVNISDLDTAEGTYQLSAGEHTVKYTLKDPTLIGLIMGSTAQSYDYGATFAQCISVSEVIIPNSVTTIGDYAFSSCTGLTSVTIGNGVMTIGQSAFQFCRGLTNITIGNSVTTIGRSVFQGCTGLTSVTIPNSVTTIGTNAFDSCTGLTSITIPNSVTTIGEEAFQYCSGLTSAIIGNGVTTISNSSFYQCTGLTNVTIGNGVTTIDYAAFHSCRGLTSITIPNGVTSISNSAFYQCTGLTSVTIGNSVTSIGNSAFQYCSGLTSITSLATTAPTIDNTTFYNVKTGGTLTVPSGSTGYDIWMGTGDYYLGKYNWTKVEQ